MKKTSKNQDFTYFLVKFLTDEDFSDKDFLEYFKRIRWKRGFVCPDCGKKPVGLSLRINTNAVAVIVKPQLRQEPFSIVRI